MKIFLRWLALDHRSLGNQPLFWVALFLPVTLFIVFGCLSWIGSSPQWNYEGFNHFIDRSKLPLGFLTLSIPFTALVTSMHRSIQTATQIEKTQEQIEAAKVKNTADLYYAHLKFFVEQISKAEKIQFPVRLYYEAYPLAGPSKEIQTVSANMEKRVIEGLESLEKEIDNILKIFSKKDSITVDTQTTKKYIKKSLGECKKINSIFYSKKNEKDILKAFSQTLGLLLHVIDITNCLRPLYIENIENKIQQIEIEAKEGGIEQLLIN